MSLGLLTPLALGLLAMLIGPLLVHLVRQRPATQQPFGAMLLRLIWAQARRPRRVSRYLLEHARSHCPASCAGRA